jgi:hypothetical protein
MLKSFENVVYVIALRKESEKGYQEIIDMWLIMHVVPRGI